MTDLANDYGRLIVALLCLATTLACFNSSLRVARSVASWTALAAVVRLGGAIVLYAIADVSPRSDAVLYYEPWAQAVLNGAVAYRDLATSFSPGFSYLLAGLYWLWPSPLAFICFFLLCDTVACWLWLKIGQRQAVDPRVLGPLLALNPATLSYALMGQDESLILLLSGLLVLALLAGRERLAALWLVLGLLLTKIVFAIFALPWSGTLLRRPIPLLIVALPLVACLGAILLAGGNPLLAECDGVVDCLTFTHGNLFYLSTALGTDRGDLVLLFDVALLLAFLAAAIFFLVRPSSSERLLIDLCVLVLLWSVLARSSWYEVLMLPALAIVALTVKPSRSTAALVILFSALCAQMARLWWVMTGFGDLAVDAGDDGGAIAAFGIIQLAFVAAKLALMVWLLRLRRGVTAAASGA